MPLITAIVAALLLALAPASRVSGGVTALGELNKAAGPAMANVEAPAVPAPLRDVVPQTAAGDKLLAASSRFLGIPYVLGPLGEGAGGEFDRGPLVSFTGLDCTTFVEEALASALAGGGAPDPDLLRRIRYKDGEVSYQARNHFTELDWLPNNIAAGFLRDITAEVAGPATASVSKSISKKAWYAGKTLADLKGFDGEPPQQEQARLERLRALGGNMPDARATIAYVPLADLPALLPRIPSGTVVAIVREDRADKPTLVSHQFFIFDGPGGKIIRHAAYGKQVMDVPAAQYIAGLAGASWKVLGFNLAAVARPLP
jgi:hypothetical protein